MVSFGIQKHVDIAQKVKAMWAKEGDENSKMFHSILKRKQRKMIVCDCGGDKVPGPNGFNFSFVKHSMDIHKLDIMVQDPRVIKYFRPISLIGVMYKILAKTLAVVVGSVISIQ
uniref:Uncharacterized protein n=1 Tax=Lactuca sativa TaxID=4236 RepID=A0A9R1UTT9_LACSA|nr:hypothetical protein LSAT_V11C800417590 [Lactuca sativa]